MIGWRVLFFILFRFGCFPFVFHLLTVVISLLIFFFKKTALRSPAKRICFVLSPNFNGCQYTFSVLLDVKGKKEAVQPPGLRQPRLDAEQRHLNFQQGDGDLWELMPAGCIFACMKEAPQWQPHLFRKVYGCPTANKLPWGCQRRRWCHFPSNR